MARYVSVSLGTEFDAVQLLGFGGADGFAPEGWADDENPPPMLSEPVEGWVAEGLARPAFDVGSITPGYGQTDDDQPRDPVLNVSTPQGLAEAHVGDWVVRAESGMLRVMNSAEFVEWFAPIDDEAPADPDPEPVDLRRPRNGAMRALLGQKPKKKGKRP